jgi:two-component system sensor histidine kinase GlrK
MRVSTRIIFGIASVMVLALLALIYQIHIIRKLGILNHDQSRINIEATKTASQMRYQLAPTIDEFSRKYFLSDRIHYGPDLDNRWRDFQDAISDLRQLTLSEGEKAAIDRVDKAWKDYQQAWASQIRDNPEGQIENFPLDLDTSLQMLQFNVDELHDTVKSSVEERVKAAAAVGLNGERVSLAIGCIALALGGFISILLLYTINRSVRQLSQGTHAIAQGDFGHRIPAKGRDEFAEVARDFNSMSQRLGELDQMKKDFVSHVSHDLKAPLASIRQTAHLLLEQIPGPLNDHQKRLLRLSYNSAERLAAMVGNLLDVSRLEAGSMEYVVAPVDLVALAKSVAEEFGVSAGEKEIVIRIKSQTGGAVIVPCDRDRMVQVIGNLIDNALKFSPRNSEILVTIEESAGGADRLVTLSVSDNGPGVGDDHKLKIFEKFHQVKYGKKIAGQGVGLGLAICKSIVEAHQGRIWVEDNPSGGSVFSFRLQGAARMEVAHAADVR